MIYGFSPLLDTLIATSRAHLSSSHLTPAHYDLSEALLENLVEFISCGFSITLSHLPTISLMCFGIIQVRSDEKGSDGLKQHRAVTNNLLLVA